MLKFLTDRDFSMIHAISISVASVAYHENKGTILFFMICVLGFAIDLILFVIATKQTQDDNG